MGEPLRVEPADLDTLATKLNDLADANGSARKYIGEWLNMPTTSGRLFFNVIQSIHEVRIRLEGNYDNIARLTRESSAEIARTAQTYRTTDRTTAETLDRSYPGDK